MLLAETLRVVLRRWPLIVALLLVTSAAAVGSFSATSPTYVSTAQVLFLPPLTAGGPDAPRNPFLALGQALNITSGIVQTGVTDQESSARVLEETGSADYSVTPNLNENGGPTLIVTTKDSRPAVSARTRDVVVEDIEERMQALQTAARAPSNAWITTSILTESPRPEREYKTQLRSGIAVGGAGFVVSFAMVFLLERMRSARRRDVLDESEPQEGPPGGARVPMAAART